MARIQTKRLIFYIFFVSCIMTMHLCLCYQKSLNNVFGDIICMVNNYSIFALNYMNVEELYFWSFLEGMVKDSVKLLQ